MSNDWNELEEYVKTLLSHDQPIRTPLSGGTKKEEDVVGIQSLSQCKFTQDKNLSILASDLARLVQASRLLRKFPIFVSESNAGKIVSLPITPDTELIVSTMLMCATILHGLTQLEPMAQAVDTMSTLSGVNKEHVRIKKLYLLIRTAIDEKLEKVNSIIDSKYVNLTTYNLFEGDSNGIE